MSNLASISDKRVAVIIVNWNGWTECVECLDSLFAQSHENIRVFIVDNDSQDGSIERIACWCDEPKADPHWRRHPGVRRLTDRAAPGRLEYRIAEFGKEAPLGSELTQLTLVRSGGNLGFAGGCNVGINAAGTQNFDYFWFLNADAVVDHLALVELLVRAEKEPRTGMVGSTIRYYDSPDVIQAMGGAQLNRSDGSTRHIGEGASLNEVPSDGSAVESKMSYIMGASMLVSKSFIAEVGLMEEDYFLYFEDADWAIRGSDRFALGFAPRSHVFHKWGVNSHKAASLFSSRLYYRNRLRFVARFLPGRLNAAKRAMFEQLLRHLVRRRWSQARIVFSTLWSANKITAGVAPRS